MAVHFVSTANGAASCLSNIQRDDVVVLLAAPAPALFEVTDSIEVYYLASPNLWDETGVPARARPITASDLLELTALRGPVITWGG